MNKTIKDVFDKHLELKVFDNKVLNNVKEYRLSYLNSNPETLEFFGGNLLGVVPLRFTEAYVIKFFDEVLNIDKDLLSRDLKEVESIDQNFKVSSDVFNLTIMYVIHRFLTTKALNNNKRLEGASETGTIFFYRTMAALTANSFKYNADPDIVKAAYSNMSNKFLIKKLGSWNKVIEDRVNNLIDKKSKHVKYLIKFKPDDRILYAITDSQGSLKTLFYNYYGEIVKAAEANESISTTSSTMKDAEGREVIKDKLNSLDSIIDSALNDLSKTDSYFNEKLLYIILDITNNISQKELTLLIKNLSINFSNNDKLAEEIVRKILIYSFNYLTTKRQDVKLSDLPAVLIALRNSFTSSRNKDKYFLELKKDIDRYIKSNKIKKLNDSKISSLRTGLMLYIVLKTFIG